MKDTENKILTFMPGEAGITIAVKSSGHVIRDPGYLLSSTCVIDVQHFPFDVQRCPIVIGTWSYVAQEVSLLIMTSSVT